MTYPKTVYLIRHAEEDGDKDNPHLSAQGKRRAQALVDLFAPDGQLPGTQLLFATDASRHSNRCVETLTPFSRMFGLSINHERDDDEYKDLAKRLKSGRKYQGATILVCWHHGNIPALAMALGVQEDDLPWREWPDDVYDRVWVLEYGSRRLRSIRSEFQGVEV